MYVLHAREHHLTDVAALLEAEGISDVEVHRPFLGKSVIHCASQRSADLLRTTVEGLRAA
jgi:hypothetical protein